MYTHTRAYKQLGTNIRYIGINAPKSRMEVQAAQKWYEVTKGKFAA
jgi:hypothetical protein